MKRIRNNVTRIVITFIIMICLMMSVYFISESNTNININMDNNTLEAINSLSEYDNPIIINNYYVNNKTIEVIE